MSCCLRNHPANNLYRNFIQSSRIRAISNFSYNTIINDVYKGITDGKRSSLAKAITLIESSLPEHYKISRQLLQLLLESKHQRRYFNQSETHTLRLGIAGPPGAGKSSFIDLLGLSLIQKNHHVAVIPVDPSSHISGGSILGDKTRMDLLSREPYAYIRGSPTRGILGGIAEHTADVIALCEAAKYDVVIIESVGLGQSEIEIDRAVDMLILLIPPTGGDSLQAAKKGIMEAVDMIIITKGDNDLLQAAQKTKADYLSALHFITPKYPNSACLHWTPSIFISSIKTKLNLLEIENTICNFHNKLCETGYINKKRSEQNLYWLQQKLNRLILSELNNNYKVQLLQKELNNQVKTEKITPDMAAHLLYQEFIQSIKSGHL